MEDWIYAGKYPRIFMELIDRTVRRRTGGEDHRRVCGRAGSNSAGKPSESNTGGDQDPAFPGGNRL